MLVFNQTQDEICPVCNAEFLWKCFGAMAQQDSPLRPRDTENRKKDYDLRSGWVSSHSLLFRDVKRLDGPGVLLRTDRERTYVHPEPQPFAQRFVS